MEETTQTTDVSTEASIGTAESTAASAPAGTSPEARQADASQSAAPEEQSTEQAEAAVQVPENDDDLKDQENNPHVQAIIQLRQELRARNQSFDSVKGYQTLAEKQVDPAVALANHELVSLLHSPDPKSTNPDDYVTVPFLQRAEQESPGIVDQMYKDITQFVVERNGVQDTVLRHQVRAWGLNPDNIKAYQDLESGKLNVVSGIVSSEDLAKIDPKFHEGFKSLPPQAQQDILNLTNSEQEADRLTAQTYLQNAQRAIAAENFEKQIRETNEARERAEEQAAVSEVETQSRGAVQQATKEIYDSLFKSLASDVKFSSDELQNATYMTGIMSSLYTLLDPNGRSLILDSVLQKAGISLDSTIAGVQVPFDQLVESYETNLAKATRYEHPRFADPMRARDARAAATQARQFITLKLNQVKMALTQPTANGVAARNGNGGLGATARIVPSGNGAQPKAGESPYEANPHPFGTPEWAAYIKRIDKQMNVGGAAFTN